MLFGEVSPGYAHRFLTQLYNLMHLHVKLCAKIFQLNGFLYTWRHLCALIHQQTSQNHVVAILEVDWFLLILSDSIKTEIGTSGREIIV
jgi:hypothetical protein